MSIRMGLALCALAGCTMQPARSTLCHGDGDVRLSVLDGFAKGNVLCLGVEHLPPDGEQSSPRALPAHRDTALPGAAVLASDRSAMHGEPRTGNASLTSKQNDRIEDMALRFYQDLQGQDLRRLRREFPHLNLPVASTDEQSPGIQLQSDEKNAEDAEQRLGENGQQVLRRPLQRLMRRASLVHRMELRISDLTELTELPAERGSQDDAARPLELGRLTMVVRPNRSGDPLEIGYRRDGLAVSTSQQQLKFSYTIPIAEALFLDLRARQTYLDDSWQLRADLRWECSRASTVHLVFGEDLAFQSDAAPYAQDPSAPTGVPGIQLFAVHYF
jgi:hypothetical protein